MTRDKSYGHTSLLTSNTKFIVAFAWMLMQSFLLYRNGITTDGEAGIYIDEARSLINVHHLSSKNYWFYIVEIGLIAVSFKLKLGFVLPIIIQLGLNGLATFSFYNFSKNVSGEIPALIGSLLLVLYYP